MSERRKRSDTVAGRQEIVEGALLGPIEPPRYVSILKRELPFWNDIVQGKARRAWTRQDLIAAADLARSYYQIEKLTKDLRKEGYADAGRMNPKAKALDMLVKRARLLSCYLQIHAEATQGKSGKQVEQNTAHKDAAEYAEGSNPTPDDDGLIPGITVQ